MGPVGTVETVGTVGPVGPVALVLLILQFWLTLLAVLVNLAIQLFAIQLSIASTELCELVSFVVLLESSPVLNFDTSLHPQTIQQIGPKYFSQRSL